MRELYGHTPLTRQGGEYGPLPSHFDIDLAPAQRTRAMTIILVDGIEYIKIL